MNLKYWDHCLHSQMLQKTQLHPSTPALKSGSRNEAGGIINWVFRQDLKACEWMWVDVADWLFTLLHSCCAFLCWGHENPKTALLSSASIWDLNAMWAPPIPHTEPGRQEGGGAAVPPRLLRLWPLSCESREAGAGHVVCCRVTAGMAAIRQSLCKTATFWQWKGSSFLEVFGIVLECPT